LAYGQSKDNQFKSNNIVINSGAIEVEKKSNKIFFNGGVFIKSGEFTIEAREAIFNKINKIFFNDGVFIKSGEFTIEAREAIFNKINKIISVYGEPSKISSTAKNNFFTGSADEIIFTETDKIQLVGNATIYYDDISISSKEIILNARNGEVLSNN
jgi:lipopolysaccharide export system protein LptA